LFSYSPLEGNNTVYNASLLGSKLLSYCYHYTKVEELKVAARESILACVNTQLPDGSWYYGELPVQNWIDSFHTGYNLDAIQTYQDLTGDNSFQFHIEKGFDFYIQSFFLDDGTPKYYHDRIYPIDIHCPAQLFVTLRRLNLNEAYRETAEMVMRWTIDHMQDKKGYFYYQLKKGFSSRISYMRWSNAFMFYSMSNYLLNTIE
jgi:rhamnogalacturonyl hydrolase YesR